MKVFILFLAISVLGCNPESSPEGRSKLRDQDLAVQIDSLKKQNQAILDSIRSINKN